MGKRGKGRGGLCPRPHPHPRAGINFPPRPHPYLHPCWGRGFFPTWERGPGEDGFSPTFCHPSLLGQFGVLLDSAASLGV